MKDMLWYDRKRIFGMPISFTRYFLFEDKLIHSKGMLFTREGEILLYRIMDLEIKYSLFDRLLGIGTVVLYGSDVTESRFEIEKVKNPRDVLNYLSNLVEVQRAKLGIQGKDILGVLQNPGATGFNR